MKRYQFSRRLNDGSVRVLGTAVQEDLGWRFVSDRSSSRKHHSTLEKCLPRWTHYPDGCESREV